MRVTQLTVLANSVFSFSAQDGDLKYHMHTMLTGKIKTCLKIISRHRTSVKRLTFMLNINFILRSFCGVTSKVILREYESKYIKC